MEVNRTSFDAARAGEVGFVHNPLVIRECCLSMRGTARNVRMLMTLGAADTSFWQAHVTKKVTHTDGWSIRHYWWAMTHRNPQDVVCGFMEELRHRHCS